MHRAATALNIAQPAASKLLHELEEMLGASLFERLPRGMRATLTRHARTVLGSLNQAQQEIDALRSGTLGSVAVGTITSPAVKLLPSAVAQVSETHPRICVSVELDSSNVLLEKLSQGKLDLVIARLSAEHDRLALRYEPLSNEPICAVARRGHPLSRATNLSLNDLEHHAWILPPSDSLLRHRFDSMFQRASLAPPSNVVETSAIMFLTCLLERTNLIAVLAADVAHYYAAAGIVTVLPFDLPCAMDDFGIVTCYDRPITPASSVVVDAIRTLNNRRTF
jgi:DNA-binding transcriptional LysR family regulator